MNAQQQTWHELILEAVSKPGLILAAYTAFHNYSLGNQIAAMVQCEKRGLPIGPLNTYPRWKALNRQVRRGEKALWLYAAHSKSQGRHRR